MTVTDGRQIALAWNRRDRNLSSADAVRETIRMLILSGGLEPGTKLGEEDLARQLVVSRTPVREALLRLLTEKLVQRGPGRSLVVARITPDEILEIYVVRKAVDGLAARLAAEAARPLDIANLHWITEKLRAAADVGDAREMASINLELHEAIGVAGRNDFLVELMHVVHNRVRRFPGTTFSTSGRPARAIAEHEAILKAIENRRPDQAEQLARDHMDQAMQVRVDQLRGQ